MQGQKGIAGKLGVESLPPHLFQAFLRYGFQQIGKKPIVIRRPNHVRGGMRFDRLPVCQ